MSKTLKKAIPARYRSRASLGLGLMLGCGLLFWLSGSRSTGAPPVGGANRPSDLASVKMVIRGPEEPRVGQRCTIEVIVFNSAPTPIKNLGLQATLDAGFEQDSKERQHRATVEVIDPEDVQIVRLSVTPRKVGASGIDFTLRAGDGSTEQVRQVWPVLPEGAQTTAPGEGTTALKFKVTTLRECLVERPNIALIQVTNSAARPMAEKMDLVVSYASIRPGAQTLATPNAGANFVFLGPDLSRKSGFLPVISTNPTRQVTLTLPALGAGENWTLPVRLVPRRPGDLGIAITPATPTEGANSPLATARVQAKFDPRLTPEQVVPVRGDASLPIRLPQTLSEVPEVSLEDPCDPRIKGEEAFERVAALVEKVNHVNRAKTDAFVATLAQHRADVRGLPIVMGDDCRLSPEQGQHFLMALGQLRVALGNPANMPALHPGAADPAVTARIAAIVQVVGPEGAQAGQQAVKALAALPHAEATRALANLAIFAEEESVRKDALAALASRAEKEITPILAQGLNYPWPAVAQRSTEALVALKRQDMADKLIDMLDRSDPRAPRTTEKEGKPTTTVREMVRINHLRNCLLCHPPADPARLTAAQTEQFEGKGGRARPDVNGLTAPVPLPGQALPTPTPHGGYGHFSVPDTLVAFDVTYLRQDFSVKLPVAEAKPWPETQRFDFLVRTREVTDRESEAYRALLKQKPGELSPYQQAALTALRQLTGRDAEPTAAAWRQVLAEKK